MRNLSSRNRSAEQLYKDLEGGAASGQRNSCLSVQIIDLSVSPSRKETLETSYFRNSCPGWDNRLNGGRNRFGVMLPLVESAAAVVNSHLKHPRALGLGAKILAADKDETASDRVEDMSCDFVNY